MLADEAEECGVTVHFTAVPASERTPETQLFTNITGAFHEYDRLRILKRTRDGLVGRAKAGYAPGGRPPLGYRYVKHPQKGGYYEVHAKEAALVREIFALYTTDGLSIGDIARRLTVERVPTCQDRRTQEARKYGPGIWYTSAVARILSNTAYIGTIHWDKYERQTSPSNPDNKTGWRKKDSETWQAIPVPALIDEALFQAAQARKSRNLQEKPRNKKHEYLLSNGRPRCGVCGYTMAGRVSTSPRTGVFIAVAGRSTSPSCVKGISRLRRSKSRSGRPSNGSYATPR